MKVLNMRLAQGTSAIKAFFDRNESWWNRDATMTNFASAQHAALINSRSWRDASQEDQLAEVERRVREEFPDRFDDDYEAPKPMPPKTEQRRRAAPVAPSRPTNSSSARPDKNPYSFASIEDEAERAMVRSQFSRMKQQIPNFTEREYMEIYNNPKADILSIQKQLKERTNGQVA